MPASAVVPLVIRLFGAFEVQVGGAPLPRLRTRKAQWLLALLALRPGAEVARDWLAGTLWPDSREAAALANLRSVLKDLRGALGPEAGRLCSPTTRTLALDLAGAALDVREFDAATRAGDLASLQRAVELYRGPLLEDCREEWVFQERQSREQEYLTALEALAGRALEARDTAGAERLLRRAIAVDPLRESAHRRLMQLLTEGGNSAAGLLVYRELRQRLHREINTAPDTETTALYQQLRAEAWQRAQSSASAATSAPLADLPAELPPLRSLETFRHNLPLQLTSFVGRSREMQEVRRLLSQGRLLTLTGPGGCGKTRLSLQIAADLLEEYPDGVWFVELAPLSDERLVPSAVASVLGMREEPGRPVLQALTEGLASRQLLLILDNCEHLITACAALADTMLRRCPCLRILASSREALGIAGEMAYRVPSLPLPDPDRPPPAGKGLVPALTRYEAVRLFIDRATSARPEFAMTNANAPAVAEICHQLDGIPLAIELAAARVKALPVEQLAARLGDRFRMLTHGSRTALPRHRTLRALIDWSYDLLSEPERLLLARLSVFAGGWTLEAAEAVCAGEGIEAREVLDLLTALVEKSLVAYEELEGEARYRLLETLREYARERLLETGAAETVLERHRDWFLVFAEQAWNSQLISLNQTDRERDNLRAALVWSMAHGQGEAGLRLSGKLWWYWEVRGYVQEGQEHLGGLLALPGAEAPTAARADALRGAGRLALAQGNYHAAHELLEESLALWRKLEDKKLIAWLLNDLGMTVHAQGDYGAARVVLEDSLVLFREAGNKGGIAWSLRCLGCVALSRGDYMAARTFFEESLAVSREIDYTHGIAFSLEGLGSAAGAQGEYGAARTFLEESLTNFRELRDKGGIVRNLEGLAALAIPQAQPERAARLFGAVQGMRAVIGAPLPGSPADRANHDRSLNAARNALGEEAFAAAWAEGRAMLLDEAVHQALEDRRGG